MPLGEGWFISLLTGEAIPIDEHAHFVKMNPKKFGFKPDDLKDLLPGNPNDRIEILKRVMRKGFARVRAHGNRVVVEFDWPNLEDALAYIVQFLSDNFGKYTAVELHDIYRHKQYHEKLETLMNPDELLRTVGIGESKKLADLLKRLIDS
jgi:hypothetical protein